MAKFCARRKVIPFLRTEVLKENKDLKKAANKHYDGLAEMDFKQNKMRVKLLCSALHVDTAQCTVHCRISIRNNNLPYLYFHICQNDCREAFASGKC